MGILYYYTSKSTLLPMAKRETTKKGACLVTSSVKPYEEEDLRFCFSVVSPEKSLHLQAESEMEKQEWIAAIQSVIACYLQNSPLDGKAFCDSEITLPTHSRDSVAPEEKADLVASAKSFTEYGTMSPASSGMALPASGDGCAMGGTSARHNRSATWTPESFSRFHAEDVRIKHGGEPPLEQLQHVAGNKICADCGAADPEWASTNLGILICIECSGIHRQLGVHISKVRSLKLDVRVWTDSLLQLFQQLGNEFGNSLWESGRHNLDRTESWVWCEDSDDEGEGHNSCTTSPFPNPGTTGAQFFDADEGLPKPTSSSSKDEKHRFAVEKYVNRCYLEKLDSHTADHLLWKGVAKGDVRTAYRAIIGGANVTTPNTFNDGVNLVGDMEHSMAKAMRRGVTLPDDTHSGASVLLLACKVGSVPVLELLIQNGADLDCQDAYNRRGLHYCLVHSCKDAARLLVGKGAQKDVADCHGATPMWIAQQSGDQEAIDLLQILPSAERA
ncbi:unnamed protein product [Ostreobium quekettii]|uniref:Uncharacterized protein n=1 Tax=Ostreobium quekettii TaxID=121088 RepID=A0A8S1JDI4_9CHLO|nr:unnamed protein product [Ostreobium quekettii]